MCIINQLDKPCYSADEITAKSSTASSSSFSNIPAKCFLGGTQRKKKNTSDLLETSFISTANILKEYVRNTKKEEKENDVSADEYLAKFITSRLLELSQEERDDKRKKILDVLLSK